MVAKESVGHFKRKRKSINIKVNLIIICINDFRIHLKEK